MVAESVRLSCYSLASLCWSKVVDLRAQICQSLCLTGCLLPLECKLAVEIFCSWLVNCHGWYLWFLALATSYYSVFCLVMAICDSSYGSLEGLDTELITLRQSCLSLVLMIT